MLHANPVSQWELLLIPEKRETFVGGSKINNINKRNNTYPPIHYVYIYVGKHIHDSFVLFVLFVTNGLIFGNGIQFGKVASMATLDISGALQAMVNSNTPAAMMERSMATAMFADKVHAIQDSSNEKYLAASAKVKRMVDAEEITDEQGQRYLESVEAQLRNADSFASRYFG